MSTGVLVGLASIGVDIDVEPVDLDDVNALSARLTQRAHEQRDIPPNQRYMVLSWQRFGDARPQPTEVVHGIADGSAAVWCCGKTPFELPAATHRLTQDAGQVTCPGRVTTAPHPSGGATDA